MNFFHITTGFAASYKYIFEYIPNKYSVTDENLRAADAIEIKIGQGTKPGTAPIASAFATSADTRSPPVITRDISE